jgi:hypothetical protein
LQRNSGLRNAHDSTMKLRSTAALPIRKTPAMTASPGASLPFVMRENPSLVYNKL